MSKNILFIPTKLNVGYQKRTDTYTDKLAYVIYYDEKGKLRKEKSWQTWRNPQLGNDEFENVPTDGFILNRNGGGTRDYYYWNARAEFVRVWDPRGFEFEISIPNLLFILSEVGSSPGKGLEGKFVYGWNGDKLVLLPVGSQDYKRSMEYTTKQSVKFDRKAIVVGGTYTLKKDKNCVEHVYMGKHNFLNSDWRKFSDVGVKDVFAYKDYANKFQFTTKTISDIGECVSDQCVDNYAELLDKFNETIHSAKIEKIEPVLIGKGLSEKYLNSVVDLKKLLLKTYEEGSDEFNKALKQLDTVYFNYRATYNSYYSLRYISGYIVNNKTMTSKYNVFRRLNTENINNNINHYDVFIYIDEHKINLNKFDKLRQVRHKKSLISLAEND